MCPSLKIPKNPSFREGVSTLKPWLWGPAGFRDESLKIVQPKNVHNFLTRICLKSIPFSNDIASRAVGGGILIVVLEMMGGSGASPPVTPCGLILIVCRCGAPHRKTTATVLFVVCDAYMVERHSTRSLAQLALFWNYVLEKEMRCASARNTLRNWF